MTHPGVPRSPGFPPLDPAAQSAIRAAQSRLDALTRQQFPLPVKQLSEEEKKKALEAAKDEACLLCGAFHTGPNTPACPRVATFKCNPDGRITEGTFWPDGGDDVELTVDKEGNVKSVVVRRRAGWPVERVTFVADLAEDGEAGEGDGGN